MAKRTAKAARAAAARLKGSGQILKVMDQASQALVQGKYFQCERLADEALHAAWAGDELDLVARITLPLQEARRQRRLAALETGRVFFCNERVPKLDESLQAGCYILSHPLVAADARRIALTALDLNTPVIAFAEEPLTQLGLLPVVVIGPATIRARISPPADDSARDTAWCLHVIEELTNQAITSLDAGRSAIRQLDDLIDRLDALPESELLHQRVAEAAQQAATNPKLATTR